MKSFFRSAKLCLIGLISFSSTFSSLTAQSIRPSYDQIEHHSALGKLAISVDKKYYATADYSGGITYRDVETGKAINHVEHGVDFVDLSFTSKNHEVIIVANVKNFYAFSVIDLLNNQSIRNRKRLPFAADQYTLMGLNNNGKHFVFKDNNSEEENILHIWDTEKRKKSTLKSEGGPIIQAFFNSNNQLKVLVQNTDQLALHHYDILSLKETKQPNFYSSFDLEKIQKLGEAASENNLLHESFSVGEINNLAFSEDLKQLVLVGGTGRSMFMVVGGTTKVSVSGFVYLKTLDPHEQDKAQFTMDSNSSYALVDVEWIDNNKFLALNDLGEILYYDILLSEPYKTIDNPDTPSIALDISRDLNNILYSSFNGQTVFFDATDANPIDKIDDNFYRFVQYRDKNHFTYSKSFEASDQKKWILGPLEINHSHLITDVPDMALSTNGEIAAYISYILSNYYTYPDTIKSTNFFKNDNDEVLGYSINGYRVYDQKLTTDKNEALSSSITRSIRGTQIIDKNHPDKSYIINADFYPSEVNISSNNRYLSLTGTTANYEDNTELFDLKEHRWKYFHKFNKTHRDSIQHLVFDDNSELALVSFNNGEVGLWNTSNDELTLLDNETQVEPLEASIYNKLKPNSYYMQQSIRDKTIIFDEQEKRILFPGKRGLQTYHYEFHKYNYPEKFFIAQYYFMDSIHAMKISPSGNHIAIKLYNQKLSQHQIHVINKSTRNLTLSQPIKLPEVQNQESLNGEADFCFFHESKDLAYLYNGYGQLFLYNLNEGRLLATLNLLDNGEWLAFTPEGLFDASKKGRQSLYYKSGQEIILYDQIKERYWETGLLDKILNKPQLLDKSSKDQVIPLYPSAALSLDSQPGNLNIKLDKRNGGIGKVSLYINDSRRVEDINPKRKNKITYDLAQVKDFLHPNGVNKIGIKTFNKEGWINSRAESILVKTDLTALESGSKGFSLSSQTYKDSIDLTPALYALFVGTSTYKDPKLQLNFADDDALALKEGFIKIGEDMYDKTRGNICMLDSESSDPNNLSTKENILTALDKIVAEALPHDIIVLFLSGHGITIDDDFYYLTNQAGNFDLQQEPIKRKTVTVSSKEILSKLEKIRSNKQVIIIDACHSGKIAEMLSGSTKNLSTTQEKALEFLEDKMGVYILASSESNQKSFETAALEKGLLTFSLLRGMSGESAKNGVINIIDLLNYAANEAEEVGKTLLKKTQRPVLNIAKGGSSFPIGFENKSLKLELPKNKIAFGNPRFAQLPQMSDPHKFNSAMQSALSEFGAFGSSSNFVYLKNSTEDTYTITGSYKEEDEKLIVDWYLLKNETVIHGPVTKSKSISKKEKLAKIILNNASEYISNNLK